MRVILEVDTVEGEHGSHFERDVERQLRLLREENANFLARLNTLADAAEDQALTLGAIEAAIADLQADVKLLLKGKAVDLGIVFEKTVPKPVGDVHMASNKKATGPEIKHPMTARGHKGGPGAQRAVMPPVVFTDPVPKQVTLQPLDAGGNPVALTPADSVTGTLASDNAGLTITPGADSTHYTATIPPNTPQGTVVNLAATLKGTIQGAPADFTASVQVTLNLPPNPVAVDLAIVFG